MQALIHWDLDEKLENYNLEKEKKGRKYDYQINRNTSFGFLKDKLFQIVLGWGNMEELYEEIQKDIFKNKTPICPNRTNPRNFKKGKGKYPINQKKECRDIVEKKVSKYQDRCVQRIGASKK